MRPKIRKFMTGVALVVFPLLLAGCDIDFSALQPAPAAPPPVDVKEVTVAPAPPDTPPLYCKIGHGTAQFGRDWYDFENVEFTLYRGQPVDIDLTRVHNTEQMKIQALFDGSGQKLIFCPFPNVGESSKILAPDQRIACASLYALDDDLHDGIKRTFDIPSAVRGGAITCAYQLERLRSLKPPPDRK